MKEAAVTASVMLVLLVFSAGYYNPPTELPTLSLVAGNNSVCGPPNYFTVWEWCGRACAPADEAFEGALKRLLAPVLPDVGVGGCECGDELCVGAWLKPARRVEIVVAMAGTIAAAAANATASEAVETVARALGAVPWHARLSRREVAVLAVSQSPHYPLGCNELRAAESQL